MDERISYIKQQFKESARIKLQFADAYAESILFTADLMINCLDHGGKLLLCGNGGSAADAQHFAAEMIGKLTRHRDPIPAIALTTDTSIITAVANDYSINDIFWRQVHALGQPGDVLVALSTSGNSKNVVKAVNTAKEKQMQTIALLGKGGGELASMVDVALVVPSQISQRIQEAHIAVIHTWCELIEDVLHPKQE